MIEVKGLVKYYGERRVLHGLDFSVNVGRVCGLLGPNGSGKSTTMDILAGLLGPSSGVATICGFDVVTDATNVKKKVGYLPDNPPLHDDMRVQDYIRYVGQLHGLKGEALRDALNKVLDDCDLIPERNRVIGHLSKGYKQRVALSASLIHSPEVLILDEPTEGLDPTQILLIRKLIKKLSKDRTVILSSHILSEVEAICDDVIIIRDGEIVVKAAVHEQTAPRFLFSFGGDDVGRARSWLSAQAVVEKVEGHEGHVNTLVVNVRPQAWAEQGADNLAHLNSGLVQGGLSVIGIQPHKTPVEEMFFKAINQPLVDEKSMNT